MDEGQRARLRDQIEGLFPQNGTPLYQATQEAAEHDPRRLRPDAHQRGGAADRRRERRRRPGDDANQLDELIRTLRGGEGANAKAVRVFPIAYGEDADTATLRRIAEASNGALYVASNPATINDVFTAVVSNF